ncbi:thiamine-phosphate pyrophosphorylase [candidate division KSB1 bacterium]|nr:thiamine-phosphate pyrophosphorylase [candidate division KSB1 bacterium]
MNSQENVSSTGSGKDRIYRVLDANLNRAREGLRVVEEVVRLIWDDPTLTEEVKGIRHRINRAIEPYTGLTEKLIRGRDSAGDVGKGFSKVEERSHQNEESLVSANLKRVQEALRVLEEFSKGIDQGMPSRFKKLRFEVYDLEKKIILNLKL